MMVEELVAKYGWDGLSAKIKIKCFIEKLSINSSLTFLRKTPWARQKVEDYYVGHFINVMGHGSNKQNCNREELTHLPV
jgi:uncharacterized protein (DUF2132 family)